MPPTRNVLPPLPLPPSSCSTPHHQKRLGKPTSDEMKNEDLLRQAWDAEGSPFKGQPFDPSKINMGGGAGGPDLSAMMGAAPEEGE